MKFSLYPSEAFATRHHCRNAVWRCGARCGACKRLPMRSTSASAASRGNARRCAIASPWIMITHFKALLCRTYLLLLKVRTEKEVEEGGGGGGDYCFCLIILFLLELCAICRWICWPALARRAAVAVPTRHARLGGATRSLWSLRRGKAGAHCAAAAPALWTA